MLANQMVDKIKRTAKEIYFHYDCSFFHMIREGDYDEYKSHGISEEQEREWIEEFKKNLLDQLVSDPCDGHIASRYMSCVTKENQKSLLPLIDMIDRKKAEMDTFSKILCAEAIINFNRHDGIKNKIKKKLMSLGVNLLQNALLNPRDIDIRYKKLQYLKNMLSEDDILTRASKALEKLQ